MTNGEVLRVRAAMKPISTVPRALATIDTATAGAGRRDQPAQRRVRGAARQRRHGGDGRAGARRRRPGEVRRRLGDRDPPQRAGLPRRPAVTGDGDPLLVLVGPPASGKTTVGTAVADALGAAFRDTDRDIEAMAGADRRRRLRRARRAALPRAGGGGGRPGAGRARRRARPRRRRGDAARRPARCWSRYGRAGGTVVWLDVDLRSAAKRVGLSRDRPMLGVNPRAMLRHHAGARGHRSTARSPRTPSPPATANPTTSWRRDPRGAPDRGSAR